MNDTRFNNNRIPTKWFNSMERALDAVQDQQELFDIAMTIKKYFGLYSICYGVVMQNNFQSESYHLASDEPEAWKQIYTQNDYWKIDTRVIIARNQTIPFRWSEIDNLSSFIANDIMRETFDGMTVPVHGPHRFFGVLHFTYDPQRKKIDSWLKYIQPFLVYLAQRIVDTQHKLICRSLIVCPALTNRQRTCLSWAADGKTTEEIALILNIATSTVNKHLDLASTALNANNRTQTIAKAVDRNLIGLSYKKKARVIYL
ncbi:MAG: autoinducer binding domain-containing protein [Methylobacter sp.]|nr:autoinducer binding domain-containing protein [Methylobacter sp.]